jgi:UDP-N-acetylmuramoylalanine--D-glutamate ligase
MIVIGEFVGKQVAVLGLARTGRAAAHALAAGGATVLAWDDSEGARAAVAGELTLCDPAAIDWQHIAALVLSPGIPHEFPAPHPAVAAARAAGCEIVGDIELLGRAQRDARFVGITGTNGKSTTTALIGHILDAAGRRIEVGGNLGTPALSLAPLDAAGIYVLEASSFQLELVATLTFDVAILLNITPDHLDRHDGMDGYIAAKRRVFARQQPAATAIIGIDDAICRDIAADLRQAGPAHVVPIATTQRAPGGVYVDAAGRLIDATGDAAVPVLALAKAERLPGVHNWQNAAAAYAAVRALGVPIEVAAEAIRGFPGLAHRQELVATIGGVRFINDSKATNADAAEKALACYQPIYWIAGGLPKAGGIASLTPYFGRLRHAYLIGAATEEFAATLGSSVPYTRSGDLVTAVAMAADAARRDGAAGAVVLLSPACASYDQFANFEQRGDTFRALVEELAATATRWVR